ncbi:prepilin-type N-terminal cleavage/methylation domain-containing protein [Bilifractor sp. LCP21S3_A7]|uniref:prepilin-type N-terminal cleavage/methylation domain-containing protein n=1 Tax=Bilifractor sp. LCP21S3_A7 TaxID=3438738 RepID=UPI003F8F3E6A
MRINDFPDHQNHRKKTTNNVAKKRTARDKSRSGFTLAEMLITVAIIGILAAFGFVAVIRYQKSLKQTELDDTARQIFVAAQNHTTVSRASGNWDTYVAEAEGQNGGGTDKLGEAMGAGAGDQNGPSDYDKNSLGSWNSSWANVTSAKDQEHDFRYVTVSADDTNDPGILSMILPDDAIDETLRGNGNILIEYDAKTAAVYGVWYCKMADLKKAKSTNTTGTASSSVVSSIANTESYINDNRVSKSNRMKSDPMVGYYGGATAAQKEGEKQDTLSAIIENDDRLMLEVAVPEKGRSGSGSARRAYTVKAVITGQTSKHSREITLGNSNVPTSQKNANSLKGVYKDSSTGYRLYYYTLDSVTDGAEGHFASQFCNASDKAEERLLPGENLTITVSLSYDGEASRKGSSSNGSLSSKGSASNDASSVTLTANSLFANGSANDDQTAGIVYGRHLQNLSTVVSGVNREASGSTGSAGTGSNSGGSGAVITKAKMMRDLDWSKMTIRFLDSNPIPRTSAGTEAGSSGSSAQNYAVSSYNSEWNTSDSGSVSSVSEPAARAVTAAGKFYSISDSALTAFNGNGCVISNLQIGASKTLSSGSSAGKNVTYAGLFGYVDSGIAEDSHSAGGNASGSPAGNSMTVSLLTLKNPTAENATFAGFVIGKTDRKTSVQNVTITSDQSLSIAADQAAGGILGEAESTYTNIQYAKVLAGTRLTVSANNNIFSTAGGILGGQIEAKTGTEGTGTGLSIENCTVSVSGAENSSSNTNNAENNGSAGAAGNSDKSVQVSGGYSAGGILGYCGASEADNTGGNSAGSSAGNSVYNGAVNIQNCSAIGAGNEDLVSARKAAAGLAAYISAGGKVDIENNAASVYVAGSDSQNSSDAAGFGGLIGYLNSTINDSRVSNCYVGGRTAAGEYKDTVDDAATQGRYNIRGYGYVGGFIGQVAGSHSLTIEKCFTTASAYSGTNGGTGNGGQNAAQAGNFVGYSSNSSAVITFCYATGLTNGTVFAGGNWAATSGDNYYLKGVNKGELTGAKVKGEAKETAGTPFANQTATVKTNIYDKTLEGDYPYQMISGQSAYYGDWVIPKKTQSFNGDFGILYYEIVQHGDQAGASKDAYYHGYVGNVALDEGDNNIQEVNTKFTLHSKGTMDTTTGLLTAIDGGEYVTEDGYILLLADKYAPNEVEMDFNWGKTLLSELASNIFIPYDAITESLNISGYHAYYLNAKNETVQNYILWNTDESNTDRMNVSFLMSSGTDNEKNNNYGWRKKLTLKCNPYFADYILTSSDTKPFTIRSAHQLNTLFELNGGKYIGNGGGTGKTVVTQTMDISYNNDVIDFTAPKSDGNSQAKSEGIDYTSKTLEKLVGTYRGALKSNGSYYKLDFLTEPLIGSVFFARTSDNPNTSNDPNTSDNPNTLKNLTITNMKAVSLAGSNHGDMENLTILDSKFSGNALLSGNSDNDGINTGTISNCKISNSEINGNGIAKYNNGVNGIISNVTLENNVEIKGNGFVTENNQGTIKNSSITNAEIGGNGVASTNSNGGTIDTVKLESISKITGNGFVVNNERGTIENSSITDTEIGGNGVASTNNGGMIDTVKLDSISKIAGNGFVVNNEGGTIKNSSITNAEIGDNGVASTNSNGGTIDTVKLESISKITGNGFVEENKQQGTIKNSSITNAEIGGNGVASTNSNGGTIDTVKLESISKIAWNGFVKENNGGTIKNSSITNAEIEDNGVASTNSNGGTISGVTLQLVEIKSNGFVDTNTNSATISEGYIIDAQIGKNGFINTNSGKIDNCQLYADTNVYEGYLNSRDSKMCYFNPQSPTVDDQDTGSAGYSLLVCGLAINENDTSSEASYIYNNETAGFVNANTGGTISLCSYSGKVYGKDNAAGFFLNNTNSGKIQKSYANALVTASDIACGFGYLCKNGEITASHSIGMVLEAQEGTGFVYQYENTDWSNKIENDYSAVWKSTAGTYYFFAKSYNAPMYSTLMKNCTYLSSIDCAKNSLRDVSIIVTGSNFELRGVTYEELKNNYGSAASAAKTIPYYQYVSKDEEVYPFPMPVDDKNVVMTAYGDWNKAVYSIRFDGKGGKPVTVDNVEIDSIPNIDYIAEVTLPDCKKADSSEKFLGWETATGNLYQAGEKVSGLAKSGTVTLTAKWETNTKIDSSNLAVGEGNSVTANSSEDAMSSGGRRGDTAVDKTDADNKKDSDSSSVISGFTDEESPEKTTGGQTSQSSIPTENG